ncbi:MAG: hypothetical protein ACRD82_00995, partial [Blastocatellia bacterium]
MAIRAKLVIIFFAFIIVPMFLLWARWQDTAVGSIKSVMKQELADRAHEISDQIDENLATQKTSIQKLTQQPPFRNYARAVQQSTQTQLDRALSYDLSAFLLANQQKYSAVIGVNLQGTPLFKIEVRTDEGDLAKPYLTEKGLSDADKVGLPSGFSTAASDVVFVTDVIADNNGDYFLHLIAPLRDDANNINAGLVIKMRAEQLMADAVGPRPVSKPSRARASHPEAIILNSQNVVIYAADATKQWRPYNESFRELQRPMSALIKESDKDADSQPWLLRHRKREASPQLSIFMVENYSNAIDQIEFSSYVLLALTMLLVIVAMLTLYYLISSITDSIRKVTRGARAI